MNAKLSPALNVTIEFQEVEYCVGTTREQKILQHISLAVGAGETVVLLGRSGSGKTTLLKLVNRLLPQTSGEVRVEGISTGKWDPIRLRRHIGYVIQETGLFPHLTVEENITLVPRLEHWPAERQMARFLEMMRLVGLSAQIAKRRPRELSGGQKQRVGVARALAADPPILLMDEPFGALDPVTRSELQREFTALARNLGKTILFVTHDLREAMLLGSRIVLLQSGKIVADAAPADFLRLDHPEARAFAASLEAGSEGLS
jgi:osmoprotectant transport system ATP-binding protein